MDNKKVLVELGRSTVTGQLPKGVAPDKFDLDNVQTAFVNELAKSMGGTYNQFKKNAPDMMDLLIEIYSPILPREVLSQFGAFAEVVNIGNMDKTTFKKPLGRMRGKTYVTRVGLGGRFETFRLDTEEFEIPTHAIGGAAILDWERLLAGKEDLGEYLNVLMAGFQDRIYETIAGALNESINAIRPDNTKYADAGFNASEFDKLLTAVSYYGSPTILATRAFINQMPPTYLSVTANGTTKIAIADQDVMDVRNTGLLQMYKGAPIIELPQSFTDETNTKTVLDDQFAYIVPGDRKIARLVFEGDLQFRQFENRNFSIELAAYQKLGIAILHYNNWAIYQNTDLA